MARKWKTVHHLAIEAGLDVDAALIMLWDAGFDKLAGPDDIIRSRDLNRARRALGVPTRRELRDPSYWQQLLGIDADGLRSLLEAAGISASQNMRRLPKGSVRVLRRYARAQGLQTRSAEARRSVPAAHTERQPPLRTWPIIGYLRDPIHWLNTDDVLAIHYALVQDFANSSDPIDPAGVRSAALLESAVFRPQTALGDNLKYPTIEMSAAALLHSLILDHPFHNGNKRTALVAMLVFLDENRFIPTCHEDELFKLVVQVAQHGLGVPNGPHLADREVLAIADWLHLRIRPVEIGENPIPWRKLRRILAAYGAETSFPGGVGNRINIERKVIRKGAFGRRKEVVLRTQVYYAGDGRDAEKNTIKKIREDLELDEMHGVDSVAFYNQAGTVPDDFIIQYRKTLRRLSRL